MSSTVHPGFNFKRAIACFLAGYVVVTILATASSVIYEMLFQLPDAAPGTSVLLAPAFTATVPYHVMIMILVWPLFAWLYFRKRPQELKETLWLATSWLVFSIVVDFIGFVLIKHPYSFTPYEFYVVYQPWISLIYLSIFISPFTRLLVLRIRASS